MAGSPGSSISLTTAAEAAIILYVNYFGVALGERPLTRSNFFPAAAIAVADGTAKSTNGIEENLSGTLIVASIPMASVISLAIWGVKGADGSTTVDCVCVKVLSDWAATVLPERTEYHAGC